MICFEKKNVFFVFAVLSVLLFSVLRGEDVSTPEIKAERKARKVSLSDERDAQIRKIISDYIRAGENIEDKDVQKAIFADLGKKMKLMPVEKADLRTFAELADDSREVVNKKYDKSSKDIEQEAEKEADRKYRMYEVGDQVTVQYRKGNNYYTVKGRFNAYGGNSIRIDERFIAMFDLLPEYRVKFDPEANKQAKLDYSKNRKSSYLHQKSQFSQELFRSMRDKQVDDNENAGYIYAWKKWYTPQDLAITYISSEIEKKRKNPVVAKPVVQETKESGASTTTVVAQSPKSEPNPDEKNVVDALPDNDNSEKVESEENKAVLAYKAVLEKVNKRLSEINSTYSGIDADQGYNKALWGFTRDDVLTLLAHEEDGDSSITNALNLDLITRKAKMEQRVEFHYMNNVLVKSVVWYAPMNDEQFIKFRNSLHEKYGRSDEEKAPPVTPTEGEGGTEVSESKTNELVFHWTGKNTVGTLYLKYNDRKTGFEEIKLTKECPSLIESLMPKK